ncbi:MAG TPA: SpvB/TcaC N-terminal domain-containing protein, partial [Verrucomicrobiae bacterium]
MKSSSNRTVLRRKLPAFTAALALAGLVAHGDGHNSGPSSASTAAQNPVPSAGNLMFHTDLFSGRFSYGVPLKVPPGRSGTEPKLALDYNSAQGNSWVGVGWSLELGAIVRNTKQGVPVVFHTHSPVGAPSTAWQTPASPPAPYYDDTKSFVFRLNGSEGNLVLVPSYSGTPSIYEYR